MLDDLRQAAQDQDDDSIAYVEPDEKVDDGKLFGMTAVERMFISVGLFGLTLVISLLLLIATDSIYLGF